MIPRVVITGLFWCLYERCTYADSRTTLVQTPPDLSKMVVRPGGIHDSDFQGLYGCLLTLWCSLCL